MFNKHWSLSVMFWLRMQQLSKKELLNISFLKLFIKLGFILLT